MLELTGIASLLRGIGFLYWVLAAGLLALALWKGKGWKGKTLWAVPLIGIFGYWPTTAYLEQQKREAYAKEAWAYFKNLCDTKSGEKIYKTFTGVKSVLVVKPLPPADENDMKDQFWNGDPYSAPAHANRGHHEAAILTYPNAPATPTSSGRGFDFVEIRSPASSANERIVRYRFSTSSGDYIRDSALEVKSRFGLEWDDISTRDDRKFWVAGSRLRIVDIATKATVAERVGFFIEAGFGSTTNQRHPWLTSKGPRTTCPEATDWSDRQFILKVLNPSEQ